MSVSITLDQASKDHLDKQFRLLKEAGPRSVYSSLMKIAYKIKAEAQLRLKGRKHIVTSRLRNSLFVKTEKVSNESYSDNAGNSFVAELPSVTLDKYEVAIGTNVEYAQKIEDLDSYLGWAVQNVDVSRGLAEDVKPTLENAMKFGIGVIPVKK